MFSSRLASRRISRIGGILSSSTVTTFARTGTAYLDGVSYAANTARFPNTAGTVGVLVEEGTTNQLPNPLDWTSFQSKSAGTTVTADDATYAPSAQVADKVDMTSANNFVTKRKSGLAAIGGQAWTFSALVYSATGGSVFIAMTDAASYPNSRIDKVTLTAGYNWVTCSHTFPGGVVATTIDAMLLNYDVSANTAGAGTGKGAASSGAITFWVLDSQLEQKGYRTSFTPTTRNAETLTIPTAGIMRPDRGTVIVKAYASGDTVAATSAGVHPFIVVGPPAGFANRVALYVTTSVVRASVSNASAVTRTVSSANKSSLGSGGWKIAGVRWGGNLDLYVGGALLATTSLAEADKPATVGDAYIGLDPTSTTASRWNDPIAYVVIYDRALSDAEMSAATTGNLPAGYTAMVDFRKGTSKVKLGTPYRVGEWLRMGLDAPEG